MVVDDGLSLLLQLVVGAAVLFVLAAAGTWLLLRIYPGFGVNDYRPMRELPEDRGILGGELWGDEGGAGEVTHRKAA